MPTFSQAASAASPESTASTSSKGFWSRQFVFASPNPSQLPEGWQLERAPMCPCNACWETGSPYHLPRPKKVKAVPEKTAAFSSTSSSVSSSASSSKSSFKKSTLNFLRKRTSIESIASDMRPLHQTTTATTVATLETPIHSYPPSILEKNL